MFPGNLVGKVQEPARFGAGRAYLHMGFLVRFDRRINGIGQTGSNWTQRWRSPFGYIVGKRHGNFLVSAVVLYQRTQPQRVSVQEARLCVTLVTVRHRATTLLSRPDDADCPSSKNRRAAHDPQNDEWVRRVSHRNGNSACCPQQRSGRTRLVLLAPLPLRG
jgi:hypothetical protein